MVQGSISSYDYSICVQSTGKPLLSASQAWVAIEGQYDDDIVQVGIIKCATSQYFGCLNNGFTGHVDFFWAHGQTGDAANAPWPVKITNSLDPNALHTYKVQFMTFPPTIDTYPNNHYEWWYYIDGQLQYQDCDECFRSWRRDHVEIGTEDWNCGDQLGGRAANHQKFRTVSWVASSTHTNLDSYVKRGDAGGYAWSFGDDLNTTNGLDVWTDNHSQSACSG